MTEPKNLATEGYILLYDLNEIMSDLRCGKKVSTEIEFDRLGIKKVVKGV
ncbi:MAG: hypothetical protein M0Q21_01680 [Ignavibacteriaceae bacterium]|nr:hypothetical protein [Ignavibacteriaceae bacterium]